MSHAQNVSINGLCGSLVYQEKRRVKKFPTKNVYLSDEEYGVLAYLAMDQKVTVNLLIRRAVQAFLKEQKVKQK